MNPIDHYAKLAMISGWIDYVRHRVKELENHPTGMWKGLGIAIKQRMDEINVSCDIQS
ncbi:hypothetical protein UFOVP106_17 [uncultured Caudovirales phage]|uniref:Uncharacterized protein n=1 Tax=uncultured Caudovirales phage TaxID=2100421 RepID=A0A6J5L3L4_9CAUD|nr:hypothetical protein UFOVP106_17 [uncultured Caudovirales phage]